MKSSSQTNRFPIGSIVGEYDMNQKKYIDYYVVTDHIDYSRYSFCRLEDLFGQSYRDPLEDNSYFRYDMVGYEI
jgi:hypothetical protein